MMFETVTGTPSVSCPVKDSPWSVYDFFEVLIAEGTVADAKPR